jgi:hypothetical protein
VIIDVILNPVGTDTESLVLVLTLPVTDGDLLRGVGVTEAARITTTHNKRKRGRKRNHWTGVIYNIGMFWRDTVCTRFQACACLTTGPGGPLRGPRETRMIQSAHLLLEGRVRGSDNLVHWNASVGVKLEEDLGVGILLANVEASIVACLAGTMIGAGVKRNRIGAL